VREPMNAKSANTHLKGSYWCSGCSFLPRGNADQKCVFRSQCTVRCRRSCAGCSSLDLWPRRAGDDDVSSGLARVPIAMTTVSQGMTPSVHASQVLVGGVDALQPFARNTEEHRQPCPDGDEDDVEAVSKR